MSHRKQWTLGLLVGVTVGLIVYMVSIVPHGLSELGLAAAASALGALWWLWRSMA